MRLRIMMATGDSLEIDGCILNSKAQAMKLAANIVTAANKVWPPEKKKPKEEKSP